jgi:tRNA (guanine26-N2/guanine27-N2)-dimethyltransferase
LTGTGLRGIRFAVEVKGTEKTVIGDINPVSFKLACQNVQMNGLAKKVVVKNTEANLLLSGHSAPHSRFDVVDIDPFGSPVTFLGAAVRALRDKGLLALTATDMASLCGVHPRSCIRKYGGKPLRTEYCHELAIRLLAGCLAGVAAKHEIGLNVVFSHRGEHYVRIYAIIRHGARSADESLRNMGYMLHCFKCFHREAVRGLFDRPHARECKECGSRLDSAGPLWLGNIFDPDYCEAVRQEAYVRKFTLAGKMGKMLDMIKTESYGPPTYFVIDKVCDALDLPVPSVKDVISALKEEGFHATLTSFNSRGVRSNVPAWRLSEILVKLTNAEFRVRRTPVSTDCSSV